MKNSKESGQLLLEILVVVSALAIIGAISAQVILVSMRSSETANEKNVALGLSEEIFESVRNVAAERWLDIYKPPDGTGDPSANKGDSNHYYPSQLNGKWVFASGTEAITINNLDYTRYFTINNVCREDASRNISGVSPCAGGSSDDPSTQKITVSVNWSDGESISASEYEMRWRNKVCAQTNWSGGKTYPTDSTSTCPTTVYYNDDGNADMSAGGTIKLLPN